MRFRVNARLPGRPDIVLTRARVAVFVDGCFWHACPSHGVVPKNNRAWWAAKLARNVERDREKDDALRALGWVVVHVWEHEDAERAAASIRALWLSRIPRGRHAQQAEDSDNLGASELTKED
jgi:DNA mismatch endonuclease (patch repair protein)